MGIENELKGIFLEESREHVASLENDLLALEEAAGGAADPELVNRIFRAAHTIKGGSGSVGYPELMGFTHTMENVLDRVRQNALAVDRELISLLLSCVDCIARMLDAMDHAGEVPSEAERAALATRLNGFLGGTVAAAQAAGDQAVAVVTALDKGRKTGRERCFRIRMRLAPDVLESGTDPAMLLTELADHGTLAVEQVNLEQVPALDAMDPYRLYLSWDLTLTGHVTRDDVEGVFIFVSEGSHIDITEEAPAAPVNQNSTAQVGALDITEEAPAAAVSVEAAPAAPRAEATVRAETAPRPEAQGGGKGPSSIRVDTQRLDRLVNLVGELVIGQARVAQACLKDGATPEAIAAIESIDRITRELQDEAMGMRMLPIGPTFVQFQRVVRDLAVSQGKQVNLEIKGKETELDKSIIEKIGDPLKHMVRNAVDHGLETPAERRAAGKPEEGTLTMAAYHQEGNIVIEIADDGKGLNAEAIAAKAVREGVIPADHNLSESQVHALIFHPGLSTAQKVTDLSGRGVGMDVVKRNIEELRGRVSIESTPGKGTRFKIALPLTLAIIDGMAISVGPQVFLIPLLSIVESVRPRPGDLKSVSGRDEWVTLRGESLPLIRLHEMLGVPGKACAAEDSLVVVENMGRRYGLLVNDILGQQQVVIKSIEQHYKAVDGVAGASILVDGRVAMILDVAALVRRAFAKARVAC
ncbi:MAG: chemotaxis protein CheA [Nitrospirae bacterium]|nr:chemotaxis protein CheA [Nitrospirota bacterium]